MLFADLSLVQRLEKQDALLNVWYAEALERLKPESLPAIAHIADGTVVYVGNESPLSRAVGFGMNGEVTDVDFDALEDFYRSRNSSVQIDLCPLAHPSLMRVLG